LYLCGGCGSDKTTGTPTTRRQTFIMPLNDDGSSSVRTHDVKSAVAPHQRKILVLGGTYPQEHFNIWHDYFTEYINLKLITRIGVSYKYCIVTRGTGGVCSWVRLICKVNNIRYIEAAPNWEKYGKKAGYYRDRDLSTINWDMIIICTYLKSEEWLRTRITDKAMSTKRLGFVRKLPIFQVNHIDADMSPRRTSSTVRW
jgi:hypothetical protein